MCCKNTEEVFTPATKTSTDFSPTDAIIFNPERGRTKFFDTQSYNYSGLNQDELINIRQNKISLIYRGFYLENFIKTAISQNYLDNVQADFDKIRNAGLKAVIRFAYSKDQNASTQEASKVIILSHIQQLKPIFEKNSDVICVVNAGFIGTWGEWYYTSQDEFGKSSNPNYNNRKEVIEALLKALPASRMIQLRTPLFKRTMYSSSAINDSEAFNKSSIARIGHHNDCFLGRYNDFGTYSDINSEYQYLEQETKYLPIGGETCDLNSPHSDCVEALSELKKFHWSFISLDYEPNVIESWRKGSCYTEIVNHLGYRFQLNSLSLPEKISLSKKFQIILNIENKGFASLFNERKVYLVLKNINNKKIYKTEFKSDPRMWLGAFKIEENLDVPKEIPLGTYQAYLFLPDIDPKIENRSEYAIQFANEGIWDSITGYNDLKFKVEITQ